MPRIPDQGGIMPVLWQPAVQTNLNNTAPGLLSLYTLNVITTQWIDKGVLFRFQIWQGCDEYTTLIGAPAAQTYDYAAANNGIAEFDIVVTKDIPPATVLVVSITDSGTSLFSYTGRTIYGSSGAIVSAPFYGPNKSCVCFAFAPTASGAWTPALGRPQFAIGFNHPPPSAGVPPCGSIPSLAEITAPNFPDQFAAPGGPRWTFVYRVVYPNVIPEAAFDSDLSGCYGVTALKFDGGAVAYATGSWSNLRDVIAQPWTIATDAFYSTSSWFPYAPLNGPFSTGPDVGPFALAAMPGQLVVLYFQPRYKDINTPSAPIISVGQTYTDLGSAQLAVLVTSPLYPQQTVYFTNQDYNAVAGGFGPRSALVGAATFQTSEPSFIWHTGIHEIPAGTVLFFDNIGDDTNDITVVNAHDTAANKVGSISNNTIAGQAVVGLMATSVWLTFGVGFARPLTAQFFVCAALSDQYSGNFPPLSPMLTTQKTRLVGKNMYKTAPPNVIDNAGVFSTVQAPMINAATPTQLPFDEVVPPGALPAFRNMQAFWW
jgi:hypothetical protein